MSDRERLLKNLKTAILIVFIVFLVSFAALAARIVYVSFFADRGSTAVVPDNIIKEEKPLSAAALSVSSPAGKTQATVVELFLGHPNDNEKFTATNMLPGDKVTKYYCLKVYHSDAVTIYFNLTDIVHTRSLGEILNFKMTRLDEAEPQKLCDDSFSELEGKTLSSVLPANAEGETVVYYRIDVSLPSFAGNEYQNASLTVDFNWYAENPDPLPAHSCESVCEICGKCQDLDCTEPACSDKCGGHGTDTPPSHSCESVCEICGKCQDPDCTEPACSDKCEGHEGRPPLTPKPLGRHLIWPWTILPTLSFIALVVLCIIFLVKKKEGNDE